MRKALIAAIVATALFAVGAFAAEFTVNADDVASGADAVGSCADTATVEYETNPAVTDGTFLVTTAIVTFTKGSAPACMGATADFAIRSTPGGWSDSGSTTVGSDGKASFAVNNLPVGPIDMVSVLANGSTVTVASTNVAD